MTDPIRARARRTWRRQFLQLYVIALIMTLIPFVWAAVALEAEAANRIDQARRALIHGDLDAAITGAESALARAPESERARAIHVNALVEQFWETKSDAALQQARQLVATLQTSRDSQALVARGNLAMADGDSKQAVTLMSDAVASDPNDAYAHHQLGFAMNQAGRSDEALSHYKQALALEPKMAWVQENLANLLIKLNRCDEKIDGLTPQASAACHSEIGVKTFNSGKIEDGRRHFERAAQLAPSVALYHANLALALVATGDSTRAYKHATQAKQLGLKDHPAFARLGIR